MEVLAEIAKKVIGDTVGTIVGATLFYTIIWVTSWIAGDIIFPLLSSGLFDYVSNWITIPVLGSVVLWGQVISIVVVICIRVGVGITQGILRDEVRAPEYLLKSVGSVMLIGLMPIFCSMVLVFGQNMVNDVSESLGRGSITTEGHDTDMMTYTANVYHTWKSYDWEPAQLEADATDTTKIQDGTEQNVRDQYAAAEADTTTANPVQTLAGQAVHNVLIIVGLVMMIVIYYDLMKRQIQMLIIGVIAPWVGIKVATESDSGQYTEFLTNLFGMCLTQWLQMLFLWISMGVFWNYYDMSITHTELFNPSSPYNADAWTASFFMIAMFGATLSIPQLVDRWTFSGGQANARMAVGGVIGAMAKPATAVGNSMGSAVDKGLAQMGKSKGGGGK